MMEEDLTFIESSTMSLLTIQIGDARKPHWG
jgi:hypothetical protein